MKSKRNQYLLLGLVLLIWGVVLWKFVSFTDHAEVNITPIAVSGGGNQSNTSKSTYTFHLNYRDPFLKASRRKKTPETSSQSAPPIPRRFVRLPEVKYYGLVSAGQQKTGIMQMQQKSIMIKEGEVVGGYKVLKLTQDQLTLRHEVSDSTVSVALYHSIRP